MKKEEILIICNNIKYELAEGEHTFTMCECGRHGCRSSKCWECWVEHLKERAILK